MSKIDRIEELQTLVKQNPQDFQLRRELAVLLIDCGYNDEALRQLLYLATKNKDDSGIFYNLGIVYEKMKNYEKAKEAYLSAIKLDNKFYDAIYNLGLVYSQLGEYDNAIEEFNKVLNEDSNDSNTYFNIGLAYLKKNDYINAIDNFQKTIDINDNDLYAHFYLGNIFKDLGDLDSAKEKFKKVISISQDYSWAYYNLAVIYNEEGNSKLAVENLYKTIEMNQYDAEAYMVLTKILLKCDNYSEAETVIKQALSMCEESGNLDYLAAIVSRKLDKIDSYISYLSNAIKNYKTLSLPVQDVKDELNEARQSN